MRIIDAVIILFHENLLYFKILQWRLHRAHIGQLYYWQNAHFIDQCRNFVRMFYNATDLITIEHSIKQNIWMNVSPHIYNNRQLLKPKASSIVYMVLLLTLLKFKSSSRSKLDFLFIIKDWRERFFFFKQKTTPLYSLRRIMWRRGNFQVGITAEMLPWLRGLS